MRSQVTSTTVMRRDEKRKRDKEWEELNRKLDKEKRVPIPEGKKREEKKVVVMRLSVCFLP